MKHNVVNTQHCLPQWVYGETRIQQQIFKLPKSILSRSLSSPLCRLGGRKSTTKRLLFWRLYSCRCLQPNHTMDPYWAYRYINASVFCKSNTVKTGYPQSWMCAILNAGKYVHTHAHTHMCLCTFTYYILSQLWPNAPFAKLDYVCTLTCTLSVISRLKSSVHSQAFRVLLKKAAFLALTHTASFTQVLSDPALPFPWPHLGLSHRLALTVYVALSTSCILDKS